MCQYRILLWLGGLITLGVLIASLIVYPSLPEVIPTHYNFLGQADGWGDKNMIFWTVGIQVVQFIALAVLSRYPQIHNYPIVVMDRNREGLYRESQLLMARLTLLVSLVFLSLFVSMIGGANELSIIVIIADLILFFLIVLVSVHYFRKIRRIDKQSKSL